MRPASTQLGGDDSAVASLALDLNSDLTFGNQTLLLSRQKFTLGEQEWPLSAGMELRLSDHAGVGMLELVDAQADRIVLVHPRKMRIIAESRRKTDRLDAQILAEFLAAGV